MATYSSIDPPKKKSTVQLRFQPGKTKKHYKPADVRTGDPSYGKESQTKPTPEHVVKAQKAGADIAEHNGKPYRAGYTTIEKTPNSVHVHSEKVTPHIPKMAKSSTQIAQDKQKMAEIHQKSGKSKKRRLPRVEWLSGNNKRTEAGFGR